MAVDRSTTAAAFSGLDSVFGFTFLEEEDLEEEEDDEDFFFFFFFLGLSGDDTSMEPPLKASKDSNVFSCDGDTQPDGNLVGNDDDDMKECCRPFTTDDVIKETAANTDSIVLPRFSIAMTSE